MNAFVKTILFSAFLFFIPAKVVKAQCVIDYTQTQPGIHPDSLIAGTVNQFYSQDVTFVMITDTLGLNISNFLIQGLTGLPIGMSWACSHISNGCNYDPSLSLYGCVRIYGTPVLPGSYQLNITVVASVALIGNQTFNFSSILIVSPASISNNGFTMTNAIGCAPLTVGFTSNLTAQYSTNWSFGNGDSSALENPIPVTYTNPGAYVIKQTTYADSTTKYYLSSVKIDSIPSNAGFLDTPDMYLIIKNQAGVTVYDSHPAINNTNPPLTFPIQNLLLKNELYTIQVWDEDLGLSAPDDNLGVVSFQGNGPSGISYGTIAGISGRLKASFTITPITPLAVLAIDTVHVYPAAPPAAVTALGPLAFCDGDTCFLVSSNSSGNQWFKNGNLLVGATAQTYNALSAGTYYTVVSNSFGCSDTSSSFAISINLPPPFPNFNISGNTLTSAVLGSYSYQWFLNDTALAGATDSSYTALQSGNYRLQLTDTNGCSRKSFPVPIIVTGIIPIAEEGNFSIYPNPGNFEIMFLTSGDKTSTLIISDVISKVIYTGEITNGKLKLNVSNWKKGLYFATLQSKNKTKVLKLIID